MCACLCLYLRARLSMWNCRRTDVEKCTVLKSTAREKEKDWEGSSVYNFRAILFAEVRKSIVFCCCCCCYCWCTCFRLSVHSSGYREIVYWLSSIRFFTQSLHSDSFIFQPFFVSLFYFFYYYHLLHWFRTISSQTMYPIRLQHRDLVKKSHAIPFMRCCRIQSHKHKHI